MTSSGRMLPLVNAKLHQVVQSYMFTSQRETVTATSQMLASTNQRGWKPRCRSVRLVPSAAFGPMRRERRRRFFSRKQSNKSRNDGL